MAELIMRFEHYLGMPIFSRHIPNPETEAIVIPIPKHSAELTMWFGFANRFSYVTEGGEDYRANESDDEPYDTVVGGSSLHGRVRFTKVSQEIWDALRSNRPQHDDHTLMEFGFTAVDKVILPHVRELVDRLRVQYGQYWLGNLAPCQNQNVLADYCMNTLSLKYSLDEGASWRTLAPGPDYLPEDAFFMDEPLKVTWQGSEYLSLDDWAELRQQMGEPIQDNEPIQRDMAVQMLLRAHAMRLEERWNYAILDACTALDIAAENALRQLKESGTEPIPPSYLFGKGAKLYAQLEWLFKNRKIGCTQKQYDKAQAARDVRNDIIHEGKDFDAQWFQASIHVKALIEMTCALLPSVPIRFLRPLRLELKGVPGSAD